MKIQEGIEILKAEKVLKRTPDGRPLTEYALSVIDATLADTKNYDNDLSRCLGCGMVASILLSSQGCSDCGVLDLTIEVENKGER